MGRMTKDQFSTPFQNVMAGKTVDKKGDRDDVYDHNSCPAFSKPHDVGPDTIPCVFEEGELGKQFYGSTRSKQANILSSPMNGPEQPK